MEFEKRDVVIVGAGLAGLSTAVFLALNGIKPLVIERNSSTSVLPKARGQNPVTMEAMRVANVAEAIYAARPPGRPGITSLVSESLTGKVIYDHIAHRPDFSRLSPERPGMASQARTEEALLRRAKELGVEVWFNSHCESFAEREALVELIVQRTQAAAPLNIHARYVVAADGIRGGIAGQVGINHHGVGHLKSVTAVRFNADLSRWSGDNAMTIHYVKNAALPDGSGILVSTDDPHQWVANFSADSDRTPEATEALIRILLGVPDIEFEITGDTTYNYAHRISDRMSTKRVFLTGDAAHVMPPTGGQGGNTAMQDGYYLGWKLAYVIRGLAGSALLETYDIERRPYAEQVCTWQTANLAERRGMKNLATLVGEPIGLANIMFGYVCVEGALSRRPQDPCPPSENPFENPESPTGTPGSRVPCVTLRSQGEEINTRHRLGQHFELYTCSAEFASAAGQIADRIHVPQRVTVVDSVEPLKARPDDAVLVRPDGVIAWRGVSAAELDAAYSQILALS